MSKKLYIIGAGGHGRVIADLAVRCGYTEIAFLDDHAEGDCLGFPIVGTGKDIPAFCGESCEFFIAIGGNEARKTLAEAYEVPYATLIHPSAQVGMEVSIGAGTAVMAGAVVSPCARIGRHCIINSGAVVEHDNVLADYVHISPRAALGGTVAVGEGTHIGIGACVKNNVSICGGCVIGAGAAIVKSISQAGVYVGVPGARLNK